MRRRAARVKVVDQVHPNGVASWLGACQLSVWDNIAGPKVQQVWLGVDEPCDELQVTLARHSLAGDTAPPLSDSIDCTFQVFSKFDAVVLSTVFSAKHRKSLAKHSLSLIADAAHLRRFVALYHVMADRVRLLVRQLCALLEHCARPAAAMAVFARLQERLVMQLERLAVEPLEPPTSSDTFLASSASRTLDATFFGRAVTSLLHTHGCAVVAGSASLQRINMFLRSLCLFVPAADLARCATASVADYSSALPPFARAQYVPNLLIQGIVDVDGGDSGGLPDWAAMASLLPTTLVLLDARTVRQTAPFAEFTRLRSEFDRSALSRALALLRDEEDGSSGGGKSDKQSSYDAAADDAAAAAELSASMAAAASTISSATTDGVFRTVTEAAPCVMRMLEQALSLPPHLRAACIRTNMRLLTRKAVILIKFVEAATTARDDAGVLPDVVLKRLRADVGARDASDFSVLLGLAERLRPGSYAALGGDPSRIEEQLRELFESF